MSCCNYFIAQHWSQCMGILEEECDVENMT